MVIDDDAGVRFLKKLLPAGHGNGYGNSREYMDGDVAAVMASYLRESVTEQLPETAEVLF